MLTNTAPLSSVEIALYVLARCLPVFAAEIFTIGCLLRYRRRLGIVGRVFYSPVGTTGLLIVLFWFYTAVFADAVMTFSPLLQYAELKNAPPGAALPPNAGTFPYFLLGGDNLARDVFSRMVAGARIVLSIAPGATAVGYVVGITLGLPAGYFGGLADRLLTFVSNLVLAFPVILIFYLLVTPSIRDAGILSSLAAVLFAIPVLFTAVLVNSRYARQAKKRYLYLGFTLLIGFWVCLGAAFNADPLGVIRIDASQLNIFVAVVFINSSTVFRIVRSLTYELKTREYIAAAQTRGESPWYIMLWEILPNGRGPLIVDFCLRIGYTTILIGTLGFFGLGFSPESPDWGSMINAGSRLLSLYPAPAIVPAIALMSLVLGLNLLADGIREESLKD